MTGPRCEERDIISFHELKTGRKLQINPTGYIGQTVRQKPALLSRSPIHIKGARRFEPFNDHVKHSSILTQKVTTLSLTHGAANALSASNAGLALKSALTSPKL